MRHTPQSLQWGPETRVIDCKTGMPVYPVAWVDDETHEVGFGVWLKGEYMPQPGRGVQQCPAVVLLPARKVILINAQDPDESKLRAWFKNDAGFMEEIIGVKGVEINLEEWTK